MKISNLDKGVINDTARLALWVIDHSDICETIAERRAEQRAQRDALKDQQTEGALPRHHGGGRPALINDRAVLTLMMTLALLEFSIFLKHASALVPYLSKNLIRELGIRSSLTDRARYDAVYRAWVRFADVIDPYPYPKWKRLTKQEYADVLAKRKKTRRQEREETLFWVCNQLLDATVQWAREQCPQAYHELAPIYCIDATPVATWGKQGNGVRSDRVSHNPDAGRYVREGNHHDDGTKSYKAAFWSYEATLITLASLGPKIDFPRISVAIDFDRPGHDVSGHGRRTFESLIERSYQPGWVVGDRAYLPNSKFEKLQIPLRKMGYELCFDYQSNQLGIQDNFGGANLVEGGWFCPSMPKVDFSYISGPTIRVTLDQ
ncbi:hypothetical protein [Ferrimicrobium sp.]|uniref:hypothetical protein n=1 Tax=Ferrimicrobium sp. TaxID=2926050 RepID=UPI0026360515|nr:hypothetical protein [Ferrimicrobium sp.]